MEIMANMPIFSWKGFENNGKICKYKWICVVFAMFLK